MSEVYILWFTTQTELRLQYPFDIFDGYPLFNRSKLTTVHATCAVCGLLTGDMTAHSCLLFSEGTSRHTTLRSKYFTKLVFLREQAHTHTHTHSKKKTGGCMSLF